MAVCQSFLPVRRTVNIFGSAASRPAVVSQLKVMVTVRVPSFKNNTLDAIANPIAAVDIFSGSPNVNQDLSALVSLAPLPSSELATGEAYNVPPVVLSRYN